MSCAVVSNSAAPGGASVEMLDTALEVGQRAAQIIVDAHRAAARAGRGLVLGCPAGRSPQTAYAALGAIAAQRHIDLSRTHLILMDEFVWRDDDRWTWCLEAAHYSCRGFANRQIVPVLNADLPQAWHVPAAAVHIPDPQDPAAFELTITQLGGIDVFLLASGSSDGHVAFNPPSTGLDSTTRVVELAEKTRRDNLGTFPEFRDLAEVPRWGVSVGLGTIRRHARAAVLLLTGTGKHEAAQRILAARGFDPAWPATFVHSCRNATVLIDRAAHLGAEGVSCAT